MSKLRRSIIVVDFRNCERARKISKFASHMAVSWMALQVKDWLYVPLFNASWGPDSVSWSQWWHFRQRWQIKGMHADTPKSVREDTPLNIVSWVQTQSQNPFSTLLVQVITTSLSYLSFQIPNQTLTNSLSDMA